MDEIATKPPTAIKSGEGSESGSFYSPGPPVGMVYQVIGKNGKPRKPTIADARREGWCVSVSEVNRLIAKPGLVRWQVRQGILSALTSPLAATITDHDALIAALEKDASEQARKAAERGTAIHKAVEEWYSVGIADIGYLPYVTGVVDELDRLCPGSTRHDWRTETAATHPLGYGGRIDLYSEKYGVVVDFKGKEFGPEWVPEAYPEQGRQLVAYRELVLPDSKARCINIFVSRNQPGLVKSFEWNQGDISKSWEEFKLLLQFWKVSNSIL